LILTPKGVEGSILWFRITFIHVLIGSAGQQSIITDAAMPPMNWSMGGSERCGNYCGMNLAINMGIFELVGVIMLVLAGTRFIYLLW